jgi:HAD superfamily hydrolase (TIGR01549 family)
VSTGPLDAVTFDYWNTLVYEERGHLRGIRLASFAGLLEEAGFAVERELLDAIFEASSQRFSAAWVANQQYDAVVAAEEMVESLGFGIPAAVRADLIDAFTSAGEVAELHTTEHVRECLETLRAAGVRVGIICDVGLTPSRQLRDHLSRHGLLGHFDYWSFSDEVGVYKPDRRIFEHALAGLGGPDPARVAHIGDMRRTDVAGARGMGMVSVRYRGVLDDDTDLPEADHVVADHRLVPATLGIS